jgi:hypothetical protein
MGLSMLERRIIEQAWTGRGRDLVERLCWEIRDLDSDVGI